MTYSNSENSSQLYFWVSLRVEYARYEFDQLLRHSTDFDNFLVIILSFSFFFSINGHNHMPVIFKVLLCLVNVLLKTGILLTEFMRHYALSEQLFLSNCLL